MVFPLEVFEPKKLKTPISSKCFRQAWQLLGIACVYRQPTAHCGLWVSRKSTNFPCDLLSSKDQIKSLNRSTVTIIKCQVTLTSTTKSGALGKKTATAALLRTLIKWLLYWLGRRSAFHYVIYGQSKNILTNQCLRFFLKHKLDVIVMYCLKMDSLKKKLQNILKIGTCICLQSDFLWDCSAQSQYKNTGSNKKYL